MQISKDPNKQIKILNLLIFKLPNSFAYLKFVVFEINELKENLSEVSVGRDNNFFP